MKENTIHKIINRNVERQLGSRISAKGNRESRVSVALHSIELLKGLR